MACFRKKWGRQEKHETVGMEAGAELSVAPERSWKRTVRFFQLLREIAGRSGGHIYLNRVTLISPGLRLQTVSRKNKSSWLPLHQRYVLGLARGEEKNLIDERNT